MTQKGILQRARNPALRFLSILALAELEHGTNGMVKFEYVTLALTLTLNILALVLALAQS